MPKKMWLGLVRNREERTFRGVVTSRGGCEARISQSKDARTSAFLELGREHRAALVRVARHEGVGPEDAVECVQDALVTLIGQEQRGELTAPPEEWRFVLSAMVRNAARNRRRRPERVRLHLDVNETNVETSDAPADDTLTLLEEREKLHACIAELCGVQRAVVTLRLLEEHAGEDVAQALGISRGYVDVLAHRAKTSLKICMMRHA